MELGMIGLCRSGTNMVRWILRAGPQRVSYDVHPATAQAVQGAAGTTSLEDFAGEGRRMIAVADKGVA